MCVYIYIYIYIGRCCGRGVWVDVARGFRRPAVAQWTLWSNAP